MSKQPHPEPGFEEYPPSNLVQCDWSEYGVNAGVTDNMQSYIDTLMFRSVWEQDLDIGDTVVLLHKLKFANLLTDKDLLNRSHLLYMVDEINGARKSTSRSLGGCTLPPNTQSFQDFFPRKSPC